MTNMFRRRDGLPLTGALLLFLVGSAAAGGNEAYIPAPAPLSIKPADVGQRLIEAGVNIITVSNRWEDNFFSPQSEDVGKNKIKAQHLAVGLIRSRSQRYTEEWALLAGRLTLENETSRYRSGVINKDVDVSADGDGFDLGARYIGGYSLAKTERGAKIDWNLAASLHAAFYRLENSYSAASADRLDQNAYDATETGLFLRPALALQPIIDLGRVSLEPFVGANALAILANEEYQDTRFMRNGVAGRLTDDSEFLASARSVGVMYGFDLGILSPFSTGDRLSLGGALTQLFGSSSGDFTELHLTYAFPFGEGGKDR